MWLDIVGIGHLGTQLLDKGDQVVKSDVLETSMIKTDCTSGTIFLLSLVFSNNHYLLSGYTAPDMLGEQSVTRRIVIETEILLLYLTTWPWEVTREPNQGPTGPAPRTEPKLPEQTPPSSPCDHSCAPSFILTTNTIFIKIFIISAITNTYKRQVKRSRRRPFPNSPIIFCSF